MIKNTKRAIMLLLLGVSGLALWSCDSDPDDLGAQFFQGNTAEGVKTAYDLVAYNISNSDTIKADGRISSSLRKDTIILGAFQDSQFGLQKASFVSQIRLSSYNPVFGKNAKIDSVVMVLKPQYYTASDSVKTATKDEGFTHNNVEAKKILKTYPIYKYGRTKLNGNTQFTINVNEVNDFLGSINDTYYSNKQVNVGQLIGSATFSGDIKSVEITKDSDNSSLLSIPASMRIALDKDFFKTKILDKEGSPELSNLSNFIRYFKGLKISVAENDGYLMKLGLKNSEIIMYYSYETTSNGTTKTENSKIDFKLDGSNACFSQIEYDRTGAEIAQAGYNSTNGDAKLYVQGMGGNSFGVRISNQDINTLKGKFKNDKIGILSAKMRFYTDITSWNTKYAKPTSFTVMQDKEDNNGKTLYEFLTELSSLAYKPNFKLVKGENLSQNPAYYDITITETLKKIVESDNQQNYDFIVKLGQYITQPTSSGVSYLGANVDNRLYAPQRVVLVGTDPSNAKRAQLLVTYTKK